MQTEIFISPSNLPIYSSVVINEKSDFHLFIKEVDLTEAFDALFISISDAKKRSMITLSDDVDSDDQSLMSKEALAPLLASLPLNTSVYLQGSEAFMWDVNSIAIEQGMVADQINMLTPISKQRRLFCTHCYTITEGVTHSPAVCSGCQRNLLVRDHFSRLHSAYVGLQIDAEDPADLPPVEELS
jgi:hypothetical protein